MERGQQGRRIGGVAWRILLWYNENSKPHMGILIIPVRRRVVFVLEKIKFITDTACDIPLSTALAQGVEWLRVDTHKKNKAMQGLIRRNGFQYRGNVLIDAPERYDRRRVAYEKRLRHPI